MKKILDTNVPMIADGSRSPQATQACREQCIQIVSDLTQRGLFKLVLDLRCIVLGEYKQNLLQLPEGGLGRQFLQWVLTNWGTPACVLVQITPQGDTFAEFPNNDPRLQQLDPADRKWVAVTLAHKRDFNETPEIVQAADFKWKVFTLALMDYGVHISFICDQVDQREIAG